MFDSFNFVLGCDWDFRVFGPGNTHYGSITIRSHVGTNNNQELYNWWLDTTRDKQRNHQDGERTKGISSKNLQKTITISALKDDRVERTWTFFNCQVEEYVPYELYSNGNALETIIVRPNDIKLESIVYGDYGEQKQQQSPPPEGNDLGLVDYTTVALRPGPNKDKQHGHWETVRGGRLRLHRQGDGDGICDSSYMDVSTVTLAGKAVVGQKDLYHWITCNARMGGAPCYKDVLLKQIVKDGTNAVDAGDEVLTYLDSFPTRYVFPSFSKSGTGNLYEEISFKPIRLNLSA